MSDPTTPVGWGIQLSSLWVASGQGFPVRVKDIALEVTRVRFNEPVGCVISHGIAGIDGMLSKRKKKKDWCISYDEAVKISGRINFTIAHELGHYLLHRHQRDRFECGSLQMLEYDSPESRRIEAQANTFASYLLMPRRDFDAQVAGHEMSFELLGHCADRYNTSLTASALKWLEFTSEAAMLVVADHDEFICWSFCSQAARRINAYKPPGEILPPGTLEQSRIIVHDGRSSRRVAAGVWHPSEEAIESVIVSDKFEQMIFLVRFLMASSVNHFDEPESDAFTSLGENCEGLPWKV